MAKLTITVDDQALKKARLRALEEGTSINAILKELLEGLPTELNSIVGAVSYRDSSPEASSAPIQIAKGFAPTTDHA